MSLLRLCRLAGTHCGYELCKDCGYELWVRTVYGLCNNREINNRPGLKFNFYEVTIGGRGGACVTIGRCLSKVRTHSKLNSFKHLTNIFLSQVLNHDKKIIILNLMSVSEEERDEVRVTVDGANHAQRSVATRASAEVSIPANKLRSLQ